MSGYRWHPHVRITPANGLPVDIDLTTALQLVPGAGPAGVELKYQIDQKKREDVNGRSIPLTRGVRPEITVEIEDARTMGDSAVFAAIANAFLDRSNTVEFSLDGIVYRECSITKIDGPKPHKNKPAAGCQWAFALQCSDLLTEIAAISSGCW